jgi:hypothetical protein
MTLHQNSAIMLDDHVEPINLDFTCGCYRSLTLSAVTARWSTSSSASCTIRCVPHNRGEDLGIKWRWQDSATILSKLV